MAAIYHNGDWYGLGSDVVANPQDSATDDLEKVSIDGTVYDVTDADAVHTSDIGTSNGVAELDANGLVPSSQLPSYVDDVLEYASASSFPSTGETGKIYVALDTNLTYRWSGSAYVEISPSLALGETSSTAYRGDRGKTAYDHATESGRSGAKSAGLYKIGVTAQGHVASANAVAKADLTALGVADQNDVDAIEEDIQGYKTVTGKYITITDGAELPAKNYSLTLSPVQDLNGYDSPWVGGAGKNKLQVTANTQTVDGVTYTVNSDGTVLMTNTVTGSYSQIALGKISLKAGSYIISDGLELASRNGDYEMYLSGIPYASTARGDNTTFTLEQDITNVNVYMFLKSGVSGNNMVLKPMIRLATVTDSTFAPYSNICPIHGADEVGVRVCGKNLFDKSTSVAESRFNATGAISYLSDYSRSQFIRCKEGTTYYFKDVLSASNFSAVWWYDKDFVNVGYNAFSGDSDKASGTATAPSGAYYVGINFKESVKDTVCFYESGASDGEYFPYEEHSTTITLPSTVYGGSVDMGGSGTSNMGIVDLGDCDWSYSATYKRFSCRIDSLKYVGASVVPNIISEGYKTVSANVFDNSMSTTGILSVDNTTNILYVRDLSYTDATAFGSAVSGIHLVFELATPTDISVTPFPQTLLEGVNNVWAEMKENSVVIDNAQQSLSYQPQNIVGQLRQEINAKPDSFAQLSDTSFSNLANGQIPKWNSTTSKWENANESGGGGASSLADLSDTNISSPADGQILKWDGTTSKWVNANEYSYTLPTASASTKGGIKVGDNLSMNGEVLSAKTVPWTSLGGLLNGYSVELPSDYEDLLVCLEFMDVDDFKRCSYVFNKAMVDFEPSWTYKPTLEMAIHAYSSTFYYATLACSYTNNKKMLNCTTTYNSLTVLIYYR